MNILISGSLAYDRIMDFPGRFSDHILPEKIHILNVCFTVNGLKERFGGTAGNIAFTLSMLDESPLILATAGKDFGSYRRWLEELGLPLAGIKTVAEEFTASAYITTDKADNQITGFNPGAMKFPSDFEVDSLPPEKTLAIVSPGNVTDMLGYSRVYKEKGIDYIIDPGQQIPIIPGASLAEMIDGARILVSNDYELELIQKHTGWNKDALIGRTGCILTTLGENGVDVTTADGMDRVPAVPVSRVKDPTGAGDAFRAGLIKGLVAGKDIVNAARMGTTAAAYAVEVLGTQEHRFTEDGFWNRFREAFPDAGK